MADGNLTMFESGAMVDYLVERYGGGDLVPAPGTPDSALCRQWCWFGESTFSRPVGELANHRRIAPEGGTVPFVLEDGQARCDSAWTRSKARSPAPTTSSRTPSGSPTS